MARILEVFRQPAQAVAAGYSQQDLAPPAVSPPAPALPTEQMSFIEVGGPQLEGSPDVLAISPQQAPFLPTSPPVETPPARRPEPVPAAGINFIQTPVIPTGTPHDRFATQLVAFHQPEHRLSREYELLLNQLLGQASTSPPAVLMFTGIADDVDTATTTLNLAITLARRNSHHVALLDGNFNPPAVAQRLGLFAAPGLVEVCCGQATLARALRESGQPNLQVITAGDVTSAPALAITSVPMILGQLRDRVNYVFTTASTWQGAPDQLELACACDALFLIVPRERNRSAQVKALLHTLPRQGVPLRGCILTDAA
jgi:Mrp family chromosome partitioning ATPase